MRVARTIGVRANGVRTATTATSENDGKRRKALPIAAALSIFAASTLVNLVVASHASAASTELYSWGYNVDGQLGNGTTTNAGTPVKVSLPAGVTATAAAAGANHSLAVGSDGKLYAWGDNTNGELGNGTTTSLHRPPWSCRCPQASPPPQLPLVSPTAWHWVPTDLCTTGATTGLVSSGTTPSTDAHSPIKVTLPAGVTPVAVAAGPVHDRDPRIQRRRLRLGRRRHGRARGRKYHQQTHPDPGDRLWRHGHQLPAAITPSIISAGFVWAYGYGGLGQIGNGQLHNKSTAVKANLPAGVTPTAVAAGLYHSLAIGSNGKLYSWGNNANGELGNGTAHERERPSRGLDAGGRRPPRPSPPGRTTAWPSAPTATFTRGATTASTSSATARPAIRRHRSRWRSPRWPSRPNAVASGSSADHSFAIAPPTPAPTTTTLSTSPSSVIYGQTVTIKATLSRSDGGGTVNFTNGAVTITGCGSVAPDLGGRGVAGACARRPSRRAPTRSPATYTGDTLYAPSTSTVLNLTVNQAPLVITASSGVDHLRQRPTDHHAVVLGLRQRRRRRRRSPPRRRARPRPRRRARSAATRARARGPPPPTTPSRTRTAPVTVNTAPLTVTASSGSMTYGGSVPTITPSYSGFVNGDSVDVAHHRARRVPRRPRRRARWGATPRRARGRPIPNYTIQLLPGCRGDRCRCARHHGVVGNDDLRRIGARHHPVVLGLRERRHRRLAHHRADVLDHGHVLEPGGELPDLVLRSRRPQLHHQLRLTARW